MNTRDIFPKDIKRDDNKKNLKLKKEFNFNKKLSNIHLYNISKNFYLLLNSGLSILESIEFISIEFTDKKLENIFEDIETKIKSGIKLSQALKETEKFPNYYIDYIKVGESNNNLINSFNTLSKYYKEKIRIENKIKSAWIYPIILLVTSFIIISIFINFIIPNFINLYSDFEGDLPKSTIFLLKTSDFLKSNFIFIIFSFILIGVIYYFLNINDKYKLKIDNIKLHIPMLKEFTKIKIAYETSDIISMSLSANLNITDAIDKSSELINNLKVKSDYEKINQKLISGKSLSDSLKNINYLPENFYKMIYIGEKSGDLLSSINVLKDYYYVQYNNKIDIYLRYIEPVTLIILSILIGFILIALIMPMISLIDIII